MYIESTVERLSRPSSECDLLLGKFGSVLLRDGQLVELLEFLLFNSFDLSALLVDLLTDFAAFLKVVEAVLL